VDAFLERYGRAHIQETRHISLSTRVLDMWRAGSIADKRELLSAVVERIELLPRAADNRRGKGEPRGRHLSITWADTPLRAGPEILKSTSIYATQGKTCSACGRRKPLREFARASTLRMDAAISGDVAASVRRSKVSSP
jgi:hypothetical protein